MELEHRFEVPVGIDQAWTHLLDMEKVAACFPGATLSSADGDTYTGTVKVKLGPIQLTYAGSARIVSADEAAHTATIEASGTAARSGSTASMTVIAAASAVSDSVTAVEMKTELSITGKPAQFGRGVMAEVGNKILGKFADCLAGKLAAAETPSQQTAAPSGSAASRDSGGTTSASADRAASHGEAQPGAGAEPGAADEAEAGAAAEHASDNAAGAAGEAGRSERTAPATSTRPADTFTRVPEPESPPIDLLESARGSIIKRLIPVAAGLVALCLWRALRRRKKCCAR